MNNIERREYARLRKAGWQARAAIRHARIIREFGDLEHDGKVRLRVESDDSASMDDLKGDMFSRRNHPGIPESRMAREEKEFEDRVSHLGVYGIIGEYLNPATERWEHADSVFGFVGDDWRDSGYDADIMRATIDAYKEAIDAEEPMYAIG